MKKNVVVLLLFTILCLSNSYSANGATGLSDAEESILNRLREGFIIGGIEIQIPRAYLNQAENELIKNNVDITPEQSELIIEKIDEAVQIAKTIDIRNITKFNESDAVEKIVLLVEEAASVVNYTISVDIVNGAVDVVDSDGNSVFLAKETINQTGFNLNQTLFVMIGTLSILVACIAVGFKYKLFTSTN